jgi:hypothetical protein
MTTTSATLTDRYVWAAARTLPEAQRADFDRELRERIGDATDALIESGRTPADAEQAVLTDLGDPAALAAAYVDRPLHLIGPKYFLTWWRLIKVLYAVVLPISAAGIVLAQLFTSADIGEVIGSAVATVLAVAVHLGFWTTLVFAVVERTQGAMPLTPWTPELLPPLPEIGRTSRRSELIASLAFLALFAVALVWQQFGVPWVDSLDSIPLIDPALWSFWIPYFLVLILLEALFAVAIYVWGWNWWLAAANLVLNVAFTVPAVWLFLTGQLFNPEGLDAIGWPWGDAGEVIVPVLVVVVIGVALWDVIDGVIKTARGRGGSMPTLGRI